MVQVRLDRPLRPAEHHRDISDWEPGVVVQQEGPAQPLGQSLNEGTHIHILRRMMHAVGRNRGTHRTQGAPLPAYFAPVVPDQIRRDHVKVALRIVQ